MVFEVDFEIFAEGELVAEVHEAVFAASEEEAQKVAWAYLEEECGLWDERIHGRTCDMELTEAEDFDPDEFVWVASGEDDKSVKLVRLNEIDVSSTMAP